MGKGKSKVKKKKRRLEKKAFFNGTLNVKATKQKVVRRIQKVFRDVASEEIEEVE